MEIVIRVSGRDVIDEVVRLVERLGGRVIRVMRLVPAVLADVPPSAIQRIAESPYVVAIEKNVGFSPMIIEFFRVL